MHRLPKLRVECNPVDILLRRVKRLLRKGWLISINPAGHAHCGASHADITLPRVFHPIRIQFLPFPNPSLQFRALHGHVAYSMSCIITHLRLEPGTQNLGHPICAMPEG
jgi:hypothetical protein